MTGTLLVGVGPGLGRALAIAFAADCPPITVIARRPEAVTTIADELRATGVAARARTADVRDEPALRSAISGAVDEFGLPDVLVYNAAIIQRDGIGDLDATQHEHAWGVNVGGAITAAAVLAPLMAQRGSGTVLLTGGMPTPDPDYVSLSLGKAGVRALAELLAARYGPAGVHVATVTVGGEIAAGTSLDPHTIAAQYVRLHRQPETEWEREVLLPRPGG